MVEMAGIEFAGLRAEECWVFKLGGRLLDLPDLTERLRTLIQQTSAKPLLVVGGGAAADLVRRWETIHCLDSSTTHWLAIQAMEFNESLIESLLPEAVSVALQMEAERVWNQGGIALLNAFSWLKAEHESEASLPHSWDVTSDSIAAYAAIRFRAAGLMLLKSLDCPDGFPSSNSLGEPLVDAHFHHLAPKLPRIAWCNLTANPLSIKTASRES
jgi:aspartokinase-like uncharacterized kinase